ncbi:S8 family serine peptidase [Erythrobacter sp. NFXS35]|uniref:S8 family serine peptidase n=1 Tax=Erythrobacter sp. NFXS35 TaxID=2818436 RepID=UPI0032DE8001
MRQILPPILAALALTGMLAGPVAAQLQVPGLPVPGVGSALDDLTDRVGDTVETADRTAAREARRLLRLRERTLDRLIQRNPAVIERDTQGDLARRGELLAIASSAGDLLALEQAGFGILAREEIEGLAVAVHRLAVPSGMPLAEAERLASGIAPDLELSADHLHFEAGGESSRTSATLTPPGLAAVSGATIDLPVGIIDGASSKAVPVAAQKGFARGAPLASDHGTSVASLLHFTGARRLLVADVYGSDPAGGNALAIARALGWLAASGSKVVSISLVGPRNALVERAVKSAQQRGVVIVAAVGNDGPAAPPAFPASYSDVLAITGVDRKGRALIEAGRALHLDYAAPGADVRALDARGRSMVLRGTSYAAPLAAARVAAAIGGGTNWRPRLDAEARDLGAKGHDTTYGRGLLCSGCGKRK